jgi:NAD(P)-dependent dehydrogenase (short-subunit alcohol dehydrogenase family)
MARVFITGSSDGLGRMAGELLIRQRHSVVLHARNDERAEQTKRLVPKAEAVVIGDLSSIAQTILLDDRSWDVPCSCLFLR